MPTRSDDRAGPRRTPTLDAAGLVRARLRQHLRVHRDLAAHAPTIAAIAQLVADALDAGRKVITFGNGGSAADAEHLAAELVGRCVLDHPPLAAVALTANTATLSAIGNDFGFAEVFARHVQALGQRGDVAIGITTSGRSDNVLLALKAARNIGLVTVALTGRRGLLLGEVDVVLRVPSDETPRIQEAHITVIHAVCELVERRWTARHAGLTGTPRRP